MAERIKLSDRKLKKDRPPAIPPGWIPFIHFCESLGPEELMMLKKLDGHYMPAHDLKKQITHFMNKG